MKQRSSPSIRVHRRSSAASWPSAFRGVFACAFAAFGLYAVSPPSQAAAEPAYGPAAWIRGLSFAHAPLEPAGNAPAGFTLLTPADTGIAFTNRLDDATSAANRVLENGSGVAIGDFDSDGRPDIFLCGLAGNSTLYRNLGGWRFTNITESAGLRLSGEVCRGAVFADIDGDRRPDLLVSTLARGVLCFRNDGASFRDVTAEAGTGGTPGTTTLALADVDGDGTLDLYATRYRAEDIRDSSNVEARVVDGQTRLHPRYDGRLFVGPQAILEYGETDILYLNDGRGHFRTLSWTDGAFLDEDGRPLSGPPRDWGLTAAFRDLNADGFPDLYVCNDYWTPDRLWLNNGRGTFRAAPREALRHTPENSMGVDFADVDRDGDVDFLVLDMLSRDLRLRRRQSVAQTPMPTSPDALLIRPQYMRNALCLNQGDGTFAEIADLAGLAASDWSWQPVFLDVDFDGFEDVIISAGHRRDVQDLDATERIRALQRPIPNPLDPETRQRTFTRQVMEHSRLYPPLDAPVVAFRNTGRLRFEETTAKWGLEVPGVHQGIAAGDFDGDGDLDLVVNNLNGPVGIFRNRGGGGRVAVRLRGVPPNTEGIGARVVLRGGAVPSQSQEVVSGGRYLSGSQPMVAFATGRATRDMELEVFWRSGRVSRVPQVEPGRLYEIDEAAAAPAPPAPILRAELAISERLFEDVSARLLHSHHENGSDDPASQPLLPRPSGRQGPAVAWFDLNGDGWDDLVIGSGAGGARGVFTNDTRGGFAPAPGLLAGIPQDQDHAGIVAFRDGKNRARLLTGVVNHEDPASAAPAVIDQAARPASGSGALPDNGSVTGPLALADVDNDGDLDLFVGGSVRAGRYPEAAASRIFLQEPDGWRPDAANNAVLAEVGLVQGAVWGDLDGDGDADLVLACEWSPLRVFRNDAGRLADVTRDWGFEPWSGWWNGVTLGDLDADGRLDLVASNWGFNTPYRASPERPAVLFHGDLLGRGTVDILEAEWDPARNVLVPRHGLDLLQNALPTLRTRFPTHRQFSESTAENVIRSFPGAGSVHRLEASALASMAFLQRDGRFEARELPVEAQFAPAFAVIAADFDRDGRQDVFLSQNRFAVPPWLPRFDAGAGLVLRGLGDGQFESLGPATSGIRVLGEQRAAAVSDFDADGRLDLVVTQNGTATRLFRNRAGVPGLRVRLNGPPGNPSGVGATVRLKEGAKPGPAHVVLAGSGYLSQDSAVLVLPKPGPGAVLEVRWPGGRRREYPVPSAAAEMTVSE